MFSATEALGLVMAVLDGHHDASDPTDPVGSALGKIMRALPEPVAAQAEAVRRTTAPAPDRAAARPDPATTTALVQACSTHRRVRLGYRSEAGSEWVTEVDPWAVVVRHGRWYLLCLVPHARTPGGRTGSTGSVKWRCSTTPSAHPPTSTRSPCSRSISPSDGSTTSRSSSTRPSTPWGVASPAPLGRLEPLDAKTTRLVGSTSNPVWYAEQLAAIPASYRIVRCPELQEAARALGQRLLAAGRTPTPALAERAHSV